VVATGAAFVVIPTATAISVVLTGRGTTGTVTAGTPATLPIRSAIRVRTAAQPAQAQVTAQVARRHSPCTTLTTISVIASHPSTWAAISTATRALHTRTHAKTTLHMLPHATTPLRSSIISVRVRLISFCPPQ